MTCRPLLVLAVALAASPALAWESAEHVWIGKRSFVLACEEARRLVSEEAQVQGLTPEQLTGRTERHALICKSPPGVSETLSAQMYGSLCAISGDYTDRADALLTPEGQRTLSSFVYFLSIKSEDATHFHPDNLRVYSEWHLQAVDAALEAARATHAMKVLPSLEKAIRYSAFADHFLQDSFASGHMGFNRAGTSAGPSRLLHNAYSHAGRKLVDRRGCTWETLGDGRLEQMTDTEPERWKQASSQLQRATAASIYEVMHVFITGQPLVQRSSLLLSREGKDACAPEALLRDTSPMALTPAYAEMPSTTTLWDRWPGADEEKALESLGSVMNTARLHTALTFPLLLAAPLEELSEPTLLRGVSFTYQPGWGGRFPRSPGFTLSGYNLARETHGLRNRWELDLTAIYRLGFISSGIVTLELTGSVASFDLADGSWEATAGSVYDHWNFLRRVGVRALMELGPVVLRPQVGYSRIGTARLDGVYLGIELGVLTSVMGGGVVEGAPIRN